MDEKNTHFIREKINNVILKQPNLNTGTAKPFNAMRTRRNQNEAPGFLRSEIAYICRQRVTF